MNDLEALGLAYRASVGQRIVYVLDRADGIRHAVDTVGRQAAYLADRVKAVHSHASERVEVGTRGGEVVFTVRRSRRTHDYRADLVVLDMSALMSDAEVSALTGAACEVIHR